MEKIGWKVVSRAANGALYSARVYQESSWCVTYLVGVRTEGHTGTPVLAFDSRAAARKFACTNQPVYKARLENPRRARWLVQIYLSRLFQRFWQREGSSDWDSVFLSPPGTLACDAIILLEPA